MPNKYDEEDNMEVYTPDIGDSEDIGIDQTTTSYSKRLNKLKEGEVIDVKLNEKAIKWRISHDLYKDFRSGVRELFQNEARACRQARTKYNARPYIEVRLNPDTRDFSIHGIDSLGISEAVFDKVLRVLGVSGNTDGGNEVGQFGMGFASYTTLSDIVTIETWYRENRSDGSEERYAFLGDNGIDFKILPEPQMETYGTKLSLTYSDGENTTGIIDMLTECVKFCGVKVTLIIESDWNEYHKFGHQGIYELESFNGIEDCLEKQLAEKHNAIDEDGEVNWESKRIKFFKKVHIDNEDYEFVGLIAMQSENDYNQRISGVMNYHLLATVPIEINFNPHGQWTSYALNIKNERKFMPTADRDRLTNEAEEAIQKMYNEEIPKHFTEFNLESIKDYTDSLDKPFYDYFNNFEDMIDGHVYEQTQGVLNTLQKSFTTGSGRSKKLIDMLRSDKPLFCLKALNSDYMARIKTKEDDAEFFRYKSNDERGDDSIDKYETNVALLKEAGVNMGEQYIKDNKIRPLTKREKVNGVKVANVDRSIRITNSGYHAHHEVAGEKPFGTSHGYGKAWLSTTIGEVNEHIHDNMLIFDIKKNPNLFATLKNDLWESQSTYCIMKNIKGLDTENISTYTDWLKTLEDREVHFVKEKTQIAKNLKIKSGEAHMIIGDVDDIMKLIDGKKLEEFNHHIIVKDTQEFFEMSNILRQRGITTSRWGGNSMEDLIQECSGLDDNYSFYCNDTQKKLIYSKLPKYQVHCPPELFKLIMMSVSSKPYECDEILAGVDSIMDMIDAE